KLIQYRITSLYYYAFDDRRDLHSFPTRRSSDLATVARIGAVHDHGQGVDPVTIDEQVDLHHVGMTILEELVVHGGIAARDRLEPVEEIENNFRQRHLIGELHLPAVVDHVGLHAPLRIAQRHDRADVILRHEEGDRNDGLANFLDGA